MALQIDYLLFLQNRTLNAVIFLKDSLQLEFDYASLTCYTWPLILGEAVDLSFTDADYKDKLCSLINKKTLALTETEKGLVLTFDDVELLFPLKGEQEILFIVDENSEWYSYPDC
jgi:hypothetical protein